MNYRLYNFLARTGELTTGTYVHDINMQDPISSIVLSMQVHHAQAAQTAHPMMCITTIEIIDGSEVLYSLDGFEAEGLDWFHNGGKFRDNWNYLLNDMNIERFIGINFGRYLWDPEYAFDPKQHNNPQLRITYVSTVGGGAGDWVKFKAWANLFDGKMISPKGFLMSKEIKQFTGVGGAVEYTEMPRDHKYRNMYIRTYKVDSDIDTNITSLKISEDQDKKIPLETTCNDLLRTQNAEYGKVEEVYVINVLTSMTTLFNAAVGNVTAVGTAWKAASAARALNVYNGEGGNLDLICATASDFVVNVRGNGVHGILQIPFGLKNEPDDWYNPAAIGSLNLDIKMANTAVASIFVEQERLY